MEENGLVSDPCFLGILSTKEQKYVAETIFPDRQLGLHSSTDLTPNSTLNTRFQIVDSQTPIEDTKTTQLHEAFRQDLTSKEQNPIPQTPSIIPTPPQVHGNGQEAMPETSNPLSAALDTLTASLNADGTLPLHTFEKIVQELSGIECLQSMLLFRPNKKKGKGGRQPAKDPRLDPAIDPKKAKRIVANRKSAARSKQKQKRHVESLQLQHDTLMIQMLLCSREKEKLEASVNAVDNDNKLLETELQALVEHLRRVEEYLAVLMRERDARKLEVEAMKRHSQPTRPRN